VNTLLLLEMAASSEPERCAFQIGDERMSTEELRRRSVGAGYAVKALGAEHLAFVGSNSIAFPVAIFAAAAANVPFLPLNYRLSEERRRELLSRHANTLVVADESQLDGLRLLGFTALSVSEFLALGDDGSGECSDPDPDDIAVLLYTSGTTADPKAVILRHRHLAAYVVGTVEFASASADEAALVAVPPYHIAGVAHVLTNLFAGRRVVYEVSFHAEEWLLIARRERITHAMVVPTMLARIVDALAKDGETGPPALRTLVYGGAKMPSGVLERALELFPDVAFVNAYGLTETSSTIAVLGPEDHRRALEDGDPQARELLRSVGKVVPGIEIEIRGPDSSVVPTGTIGEIFVRGEQVSGEYLGQDSAIIGEGWYPTRDSGYLDDDGYLFVEGRSDDTIIRGGENIAPAEIEHVLADHPDVKDCVVLGLSDDEWGERILAVVVLATGASSRPDDLRSWVRARLRSSRTPDQIEFSDALPYTETGKVLRRTLREQFEV
jgi:acyl-CoA synthetase (AMP-forming)/AMP-acid ligase II